MNEIKIFENSQFGRVRTIQKDGEPWFVAADVCRALEIEPTATRRLDEDEKAAMRLTQTSSNGVEQGRDVTIVNEPGLYSLILGSRKPEARAFKRWITHEVIPAIRKTGGYITGEDKMSDEELLSRALMLAGEKIRQRENKIQALEQTVAVQNQQIAEMQPKASYYDVVLNCKDLVPISVIAKDYGWSAYRMNQHLYVKGIQFKQSGIWLLYQKYAGKGYTNTKTTNFEANDGEMHSRVNTYWTQKGRLFIYDLLKRDGILPTVERMAG